PSPRLSPAPLHAALPISTGWRRVRSIRFRLWLWLRPGRGFASLPELWLRWGRLAAVSYGARSRPGLSLRARLILPTTEYAARLRSEERRVGKECGGAV